MAYYETKIFPIAGGGGGMPVGTKYAVAISLSLSDDSDTVLTAQLKDQNGDNLGQAASVSLPAGGSSIVSGNYDDTTQSLVLVLDSGDEISISLAKLSPRGIARLGNN